MHGALFFQKDFENWIEQDIHFLRLVSRKSPINCTALPITGETGCSIRPSICCSFIFSRYIEDCHSNVIRRTREEIHEETGISVKTLNRTIRKLKESGLVGITKGKVTLNASQQEKAREYLKQGMY